MKKIQSILMAAALFVCAYASAQMSDQAVVKAAAAMMEQGMSEVDIAKQLVLQGATIDQLQHLRNQLLNAKDGRKEQDIEHEATGTRVNNGEMPQFIQRKAPEREVFGQSIFREKDLTFAPQMNVATPQNYVLGPGDEVIVDIYGASQQQYTQKVSADGYVTISGYGPVRVGGMTVTQATQEMRRTLGSRYQSSQLRLTVGQTRAITVNVLGEVEMPGSYQLSAFASVFHALYMAGGVTEKGTLRQINVYRQNALVSSVDLYDYLMQGALTGNVMLEDGDVVLVNTYDQLVRVAGKVKRPMFFEMKRGETMDKLIYYAGGFAGDAYTDGVRVTRKNAGAQSVHTVRNAQFEQFALMDGDSVSVDALLPRLKNTVMIQGAVFRGGYYGMTEEMHTVSQLVKIADGPTEDASLTRAVLYRMMLDRTTQAVPIALQDILDGKAEDIELLNEDQLFIPSQREKLANQYVKIHGEVYHPGQFRYAADESVEDLILRAGGLTDRASVSKVDVSRRVVDPKATDELQIKTKTFTVELHDSLRVNEHGFQLEPFDEVYVRMSPAYGKQMNVTVRGEILFEGSYALKTQDDRLSDLIKAAGGLSSHAYVKGARLIRTMTEDEVLRRDQLLKINKAGSRDSVSVDKLDSANVYMVGIDLEAALKMSGSDEDIVLREGDVLFIPSLNNTVKINGEVLYPNTVSYIKGKCARYYVNQAGGFSNNARRSKAYIIYSGGKVGTRYGKVEPGCEIVVPSKPEKKASNAAQWVSIASASASMASVVATITAVIVNTTKN